MSSLDLTNQLSVTAPGVSSPVVQSPAGTAASSSPEEEAAAALVHLSGASSITVAAVEDSVPPDLAAASSLVEQLSARVVSGSIIPAAFGSLYTLLNPDTALALTSQ